MSTQQQGKSNAVAKIDLDEVAVSMEQINQTYGVTALAGVASTMKRSLMMAQGIRECTELVNRAYDHFAPLMGQKLGFVTDKDKEGGYDRNTVVKCMTEAVLSGVSLIGNEFNIIANNCYITKNGYLRKCNDITGIIDLIVMPGIPYVQTKNGEAGHTLVPMKATWTIIVRDDAGTITSKKPFELNKEIPIRVNSGMQVDAVLGKAHRKMYAAIHGMMTNSQLSIFDANDDHDDVGPGVELPVTRIGGAAELAERLNRGPTLPPREVKAEDTKPAATSPPPAAGNTAEKPKAGQNANPVSTKEPLGVAIQAYIDAGGNWLDYAKSVNMNLDLLELKGKHTVQYTDQFNKATAALKAAKPSSTGTPTGGQTPMEMAIEAFVEAGGKMPEFYKDNEIVEGDLVNANPERRKHWITVLNKATKELEAETAKSGKIPGT